MNVKKDKGSIAIFVLVALLFMSAFLIISFASNVNKSKIVKEQFNIISGIYAYANGEEGAYDKAYADLRKKNKKTMTASIKNSSTLELTKTFDENLVNYRIYGNGIDGYEENHNLPPEYQKVKYIESTGTQYIDTEVIPNINQKYNIKFSTSDIDTNQVIMGSRTSGTYLTSNDQIYINVINKKLLFYSGINNTSEVAELNSIYEKTYLANSGSFDDKSNKSLTIFALNKNDDTQVAFSYTKLYYLKIYDNDILIRNFVPCYRKSDNEIGLYDLVKNKFYTNSGTGEFIAGPEVSGIGDLIEDINDTNYGKYKISIKITNTNGDGITKDIILNGPLYKEDYIDYQLGKVIRSNGTEESIDLPPILIYEDYTKIEIITKQSPAKVEVEYQGYTIGNEGLPDAYQEVEYIESTGTQYIDTQYIPKENTKVDVDFKTLKQNGEVFSVLFGTQNTSSGSGRFYILFGSANNIQTNFPRSEGSLAYLKADGTYTSSLSSEKMYWTEERTHYIANIKTKEVIIGNTTWNSSNYFVGNFVPCIYPLFLLTRNNYGTAYDKCSKGLLYRATIFEDNVVVRDFIPVLDKNNVACMYDKVNKEFYYNQGTGEFIAGPKVGSTRE